MVLVEVLYTLHRLDYYVCNYTNGIEFSLQIMQEKKNHTTTQALHKTSISSYFYHVTAKDLHLQF